MESTRRTRTSRGTDALVAVALLLLDAAVIGTLFYLFVVSHGFDTVPDRESAARVAGWAAAVCGIGTAVTAVPAARTGAWIALAVQLVVLGGSALVFALFAV